MARLDLLFEDSKPTSPGAVLKGLRGRDLMSWLLAQPASQDGKSWGAAGGLGWARVGRGQRDAYYWLSGMSMPNVVPVSLVLSTRIVPRCACTIAAAMVRPIPAPGTSLAIAVLDR